MRAWGLLATLCVATPISADEAVVASPAAGPYRIERSVVASGGGALNGGAYRLSGTLGQSSMAMLSGAAFSFRAGFWTAVSGDTAIDLIFANGFDS